MIGGRQLLGGKAIVGVWGYRDAAGLLHTSGGRHGRGAVPGQVPAAAGGIANLGVSIGRRSLDVGELLDLHASSWRSGP